LSTKKKSKKNHAISQRSSVNLNTKKKITQGSSDLNTKKKTSEILISLKEGKKGKKKALDFFDFVERKYSFFLKKKSAKFIQASGQCTGGVLEQLATKWGGLVTQLNAVIKQLAAPQDDDDDDDSEEADADAKSGGGSTDATSYVRLGGSSVRKFYFVLSKY
jgi:hypothetical protein